MTSKRIDYLIALYFNDNITKIQKEELASLMAQSSDEQIQKLLEEAWANHVPGTFMPDDMSDEIIGSFFKEENSGAQIEDVIPIVKNQRRLNWRKVIAAAACILALIAGAYFWTAHSKKIPVAKKDFPQKPLINDVQPGGQKALLILADGTQIILDSASRGLLAQQGNAQVKKLANGEISYSTNGHAATEILFNTMSTPMGGIYQLILPDQTKVWLNSASSIRYPTEFITSERRVEVTGEAYFEVAKDPSKPFIVTVNDLTGLKVLGTHFNVNAYDDEAEIRTTLIEGSVNVTCGTNSSILKAGQQAQISKTGTIKRSYDIDIEEAVAWKNGNFLFNSAGLPAVLRQAARWYNLEVVYEGKIPDDKFSGQIPRSASLSSLLKWMQWSDVHFKLEGKKLIIKG